MIPDIITPTPTDPFADEWSIVDLAAIADPFARYPGADRDRPRRYTPTPTRHHVVTLGGLLTIDGARRRMAMGGHDPDAFDYEPCGWGVHVYTIDHAREADDDVATS